MFESAGSEKQKTELVGSEELKPIVKEPMSVVRNQTALCPALTGSICYYAHLLPKGLETVRRKTLGHSICDIVGCRYLLEADIPRNDIVPNEVIPNVDMLRGIVVNRIFRQSDNTLTVAVDN